MPTAMEFQKASTQDLFWNKNPAEGLNYGGKTRIKSALQMQSIDQKKVKDQSLDPNLLRACGKMLHADRMKVEKLLLISQQKWFFIHTGL